MISLVLRTNIDDNEKLLYFRHDLSTIGAISVRDLLDRILHLYEKLEGVNIQARRYK